MDLTERHIEALQVLEGTRTRNKTKAAVRIADLQPLLVLPQIQATKAAGSTPTQEEYDALLADFRALHARITEISQILTQRLL